MDISNQKANNFTSCQKSREIRPGAAERRSEQGEGCCCNRGTEVTAVQVELCLYGDHSVRNVFTPQICVAIIIFDPHRSFLFQVLNGL